MIKILSENCKHTGLYIYDKPLTEKIVTASFCALNLRTKLWYWLFWSSGVYKEKTEANY